MRLSHLKLFFRLYYLGFIYLRKLAYNRKNKDNNYLYFITNIVYQILNKKQILVTGGAGYLGSHICLELLANKYELLVIDNLVNSQISTINSIQDISLKKFKFYQLDIRDQKEVDKIFSENNICAVIHLAALKSITESLIDPVEYFDVNVSGLITLLKVMENYRVKNLIFSSSAVVYGKQDVQPISEKAKLSPENPYAFSKLIGEEIISSLIMENKIKAGILRYFNPAGSHESGLIGDKPNNIQGNVIPKILEVILGKQKAFKVYGSDYETIDGTGVRDYIHVDDLCVAHLNGLNIFFNSGRKITSNNFNLGNGNGFSVKEVISKVKTLTNKEFVVLEKDRRAGDPAVLIASNSKASKVLNFTPTKSKIEDIIKSLI